MSLAEAFGRAVKARRAEQGLTQADLADRTGIDRSYLGQIERGERNTSLNTIEQIAEAFGEKPSALLAAAERLAEESAE